MPDHENRIFQLERKRRIDRMTAPFQTGVGVVTSVPDHTEQTVTQTAHGFTVGQWIRWSGAAFVLAQADTEPHAEVHGMVTSIESPDSFVLQTTGFVSGLSGLTAGTAYYLSASSAGAMTTVEPVTATQVSKPIFFARDANSGWVTLMRGLVIPPLATSPFIPRVDFQAFNFTGPWPIATQTVTLPFKCDLMIQAGGSLWATVVGARGLNLSWDGVMLTPNMSLYFNNLTTHGTVNNGTYVLRNQASGPHTLDLAGTGSTSSDVNDKASIGLTYREVP